MLSCSKGSRGLFVPSRVIGIFAQPCVFVKQLPGPILCASCRHEDPFSRSYGVSLPSSLTMNLSTPWYVLPDHVCPFAVRVPHGLSLADFLGSMITHTIGFFRGGLRTVKFSSDGGFACHPQHLHSSTGTSVAPRWFHCSVSTSPHAAVTEY